MKSILKMIIGLVVMANLIACKKEVLDSPIENPMAVAVNFGNEITVAESAGTQEIKLQFNKTALREGTIEVRIITATPEAFLTAPAAEGNLIVLDVDRGDNHASFTITPINNNEVDDNRVVSFEIVGVTDGFEIGSRKSTAITILDDENAITANFSDGTGLLYENTPTGLDIKVVFSAPAFQMGRVVLKLEGMAEEGLFITQPALDPDGLVELPVSAGNTVVSLLLTPTDNDLLKGHHTLDFTIVETEGGIIKGEGLSFSLNLLDDELAGKPQSYETGGSNWRSKKTYLYNENGRIQSVQWETETPVLRTGTDTYYYAANGLIERVNYFPEQDEYFYQENGRIMRSETIKNGVKTEYSVYDYDQAGNVGGRAQYYRQTNGTYTLSFLYLFLYDFNGNLYSQLTYIPGDDPQNPILISTRTYETYLNTPNPFLTLEVIPGMQAQPFLPVSYRIEENGTNLSYSFSYEFNEAGKPVRRTTLGGRSEWTVFQYY